jgi:hypothetical protein
MAITQENFAAFEAAGVLVQEWFESVLAIGQTIDAAKKAINPGEANNVVDDLVDWTAFLGAIKPHLASMKATSDTKANAAAAAIAGLS